MTGLIVLHYTAGVGLYNRWQDELRVLANTDFAKSFVKSLILV